MVLTIVSAHPGNGDRPVRPKRSGLRFLLGVCLAGVLLACGTVGSVDGPVIEGNVTGGGDDALVVGTVTIEGDCIYLHDPQIESRYPVVWPHGTSWNPAESAIKLPDGTLVHDVDECPAAVDTTHRT